MSRINYATKRNYVSPFASQLPMTKGDKKRQENKPLDRESLRKIQILIGRMPTYKIWRDLHKLVMAKQDLSPKQYATMQKCYKNCEMHFVKTSQYAY